VIVLNFTLCRQAVSFQVLVNAVGLYLVSFCVATTLHVISIWYYVGIFM